MKLHCPGCQQELIIEDQYAGQAMQCPMCNAGFTAPAMTDFSTREPDGAAEPPLPDVDLPPPPQSKGSSYASQNKPRVTLSLDAKILQWVPVSVLFLAGIFTWFTWVWIGTSSTSILSQNGVQVAFGFYSVDKDLRDAPGSPTKSLTDDQVSMGFLTLLYMFLLFLCFLLAGAVAALSVVPIELPEGVKSLLMWKWAIVAGALLLGLILFMIQLSIGFNLESKFYNSVDDSTRTLLENETDATKKRALRMVREWSLDTSHRHWAVSAVFWFHVIALIMSILLFWLDLRRTKPAPQISVSW